MDNGKGSLSHRKAKILEEKVQNELSRWADREGVTLSPAERERLRLDTLLQTLNFVDSKLPEMASDLFDDFKSERTQIKDKVSIFKIFASYSLTQERLEKGLGLVKDLAKEQGGSLAIGTLLNIDLGSLRRLPAEEVTEKLLEGKALGQD